MIEKVTPDTIDDIRKRIVDGELYWIKTRYPGSEWDIVRRNYGEDDYDEFYTAETRDNIISLGEISEIDMEPVRRKD